MSSRLCLTKGMLSDEDMKPLVDMGIAKKNDKGIYELQRKYHKNGEKVKG